LQSRKTHDARSLNQTAPPALVQATTAVESSQTTEVEPTQIRAQFVITVEPHQRLKDISAQYLGGYDQQRLHQIQALNPRLTDPDHIETGQKIRLPGPTPASVAKDVPHQGIERTLP
jgi:nucleoid-associated protein YgaU